MLGKNKPIISEFLRNAGKLCNEWRDTIYYVGAAGLLIADRALGWNISTDLMISTPISIREMRRFYVWKGDQNKVLVGETINQGIIKRNIFAAATISAPFACDTALAIYREACKVTHHPYDAFHMVPYCAMLALSAIPSYFVAGGAKGIFRSYRDIMFDYPRKKGGPTVTRRLKQKITDFGDSVKAGVWGTLMPQPGLVSIPIRIRHRRQQTPL